MTGPARRAEPDPAGPPPPRHLEGDGHTYIGPMTYAEYRRMDEASDLPLEYVGGVVYAMSGGTQAHALVCVNIAARLRERARGSGCRAFSQGFKVRTADGSEYVPDVVMACGPHPPHGARYTEAPCLVVEVLSPSTTRTDLIEKRAAYQEIPTVGAYLIVEAEWRGVHRHWRDDSGGWRSEQFVGDGVIPLPCPPDAVLTLADVYEDLDLPATPPPPPAARLRRVYEGAPLEDAAV